MTKCYWKKTRLICILTLKTMTKVQHSKMLIIVCLIGFPETSISHFFILQFTWKVNLDAKSHVACIQDNNLQLYNLTSVIVVVKAYTKCYVRDCVTFLPHRLLFFFLSFRFLIHLPVWVLQLSGAKKEQYHNRGRDDKLQT